MNIATCHCGLTYDRAAWERLLLIGGMDADDEEHPTEILELRNCTCGSTIAVIRVASAPTEKSREAAVKLLNFEATRQKAAREERKRRDSYGPRSQE
jgi:cyanophycinase-like exopeptidase